MDILTRVGWLLLYLVILAGVMLLLKHLFHWRSWVVAIVVVALGIVLDSLFQLVFDIDKIVSGIPVISPMLLYLLRDRIKYEREVMKRMDERKRSERVPMAEQCKEDISIR